jgi:RNA polymerase sigma-70 factor (ECF subfamily)
MSDLSERNELLKVSKGDEMAYNRLYYRYHQQLGKHVFRITNSMDLAEEIVQDVFLKIWLNREVLAGVQNFKAYLFVVSKNHTLNCLRKLSVERQHFNKIEESYTSLLVDSNSDSNEYYTILDEAINRLPPQQQKVYLLSRHERLRYAEVANRMNISSESVKKYLQIATFSITNYILTNFHILLIFSIFFI